MINLEELMELGKAYTKLCRADQPVEVREQQKEDLMEEIADVLIVIQNLMLEFNLSNALINGWIFAKQDREYDKVVGGLNDLE